MPDDTTIKATLAMLAAAGLEVGIAISATVAEVVVRDATTGGRFVVRDRDAWVAWCGRVSRRDLTSRGDGGIFGLPPVRGMMTPNRHP